MLPSAFHKRAVKRRSHALTLMLPSSPCTFSAVHIDHLPFGTCQDYTPCKLAGSIGTNRKTSGHTFLMLCATKPLHRCCPNRPWSQDWGCRGSLTSQWTGRWYKHFLLPHNRPMRPIWYEFETGSSSQALCIGIATSYWNFSGSLAVHIRCGGRKSAWNPVVRPC